MSSTTTVIRLFAVLALALVPAGAAGLPGLAQATTGEVRIVKSYCADVAKPSLTVTNPSASGSQKELGCATGKGPRKAEFQIADAETGNLVVPSLVTDPESGLASAMLEPGTYLLTEVGPAVVGPVAFTIGRPGEAVTFVAVNPLAPPRGCQTASGEDGAVAAQASAEAAGEPVLRWRFHVPTGLREAAPVVSGTMVYAGGRDALYALDAATGGVRWCFGAGELNVSPPAVGDGAVFVSAGGSAPSGFLIALDAASGTERWRAPAVNSWFTAPVAADGTVYVADNAGLLYAIEAATGTERWRFGPAEADTSLLAPPAIAGGVVYLAAGSLSTDRGQPLIALDAATGAERWRSEVAGVVRARPAVGDGLVSVGSFSGMEADCCLQAFDTATGAERWRVPIAVEFGAPVLAGGTVFVGGADGVLYALDATTGAERWQVRYGRGADDPLNASPAVADGVIYVAASAGPEAYLHALDPATGAESWRFEIGPPASSPVVAGGTVYVMAGGELFAIVIPVDEA